jgi:ABC-type sugar transport system substrate-binding protein
MVTQHGSAYNVPREARIGEIPVPPARTKPLGGNPTTGHAAAAILLAALGIGCGGGDASPARDRGDARLAAVIKGVENPFFATMRNGLASTARRYHAPLRLDAAAGLQDTAGQASTLESLASERAGCYVVNPITPTNLIGPLDHLPPGTPIVNIDSPVDKRAAAAVGVAITAYVGTDNAAAGRAAADAMAGFVGSGADVAVVTGIPGDVGSGARARGFNAGARGRFAIAGTIAADFERRRARLAVRELLRADPGIRGIFAVNDEMALGVAEAVGAAGRRGEIAVIGMDGIRAALAAVKRGAMSATVAQYPYTIGQLGVEACLATLRGRTVPEEIDAPVQVVTRANVVRAQANFPQPVQPFDDPVAGLLED